MGRTRETKVICSCCRLSWDKSFGHCIKKVYFLVVLLSFHMRGPDPNQGRDLPLNIFRMAKPTFKAHFVLPHSAAQPTIFSLHICLQIRSAYCLANPIDSDPIRGVTSMGSYFRSVGRTQPQLSDKIVKWAWHGALYVKSQPSLRYLEVMAL